MNDPTLHLRGLRAAQIAIDDLIEEARAACEFSGNRQGITLAWWCGNFDGLVAAEAMLALADYPEQADNAAHIEQILADSMSEETGPSDGNRTEDKTPHE